MARNRGHYCRQACALVPERTIRPLSIDFIWQNPQSTFFIILLKIPAGAPLKYSEITQAFTIENSVTTRQG